MRPFFPFAQSEEMFSHGLVTSSHMPVNRSTAGTLNKWTPMRSTCGIIKNIEEKKNAKMTEKRNSSVVTRSSIWPFAHTFTLISDFCSLYLSRAKSILTWSKSRVKLYKWKLNDKIEKGRKSSRFGERDAEDGERKRAAPNVWLPMCVFLWTHFIDWTSPTMVHIVKCTFRCTIHAHCLCGTFFISIARAAGPSKKAAAICKVSLLPLRRMHFLLHIFMKLY